MRTRIHLRPGVGTSMAALLLPSAAATAAQAKPIDRARTVTGERVRPDSGMRLGAAPAIARAAS